MAVVNLDSLYLLHETPEEDSVATRLKQKEEKKKKNGAASVGGSKGSGEFELRLFNELYVTLLLCVYRDPAANCSRLCPSTFRVVPGTVL